MELVNTEKCIDNKPFVGIEPVNYYHFCSNCFKYIEGFDHHCLWLNCCIAKNNYRQFFVLLLILAVQMVFQFVIGVTIQMKNEFRYFLPCFILFYS